MVFVEVIVQLNYAWWNYSLERTAYGVCSVYGWFSPSTLAVPFSKSQEPNAHSAFYIILRTTNINPVISIKVVGRVIIVRWAGEENQINFRVSRCSVTHPITVTSVDIGRGRATRGWKDVMYNLTNSHPQKHMETN